MCLSLSNAPQTSSLTPRRQLWRIVKQPRLNFPAWIWSPSQMLASTVILKLIRVLAPQRTVPICI